MAGQLVSSSSVDLGGASSSPVAIFAAWVALAAAPAALLPAELTADAAFLARSRSEPAAASPGEGAPVPPPPDARGGGSSSSSESRKRDRAASIVALALNGPVTERPRREVCSSSVPTTSSLPASEPYTDEAAAVSSLTLSMPAPLPPSSQRASPAQRRPEEETADRQRQD